MHLRDNDHELAVLRLDAGEVLVRDGFLGRAEAEGFHAGVRAMEELLCLGDVAVADALGGAEQEDCAGGVGPVAGGKVRLIQ